MKCHEILTVINKINISSLGGLQSIVKRCADAVLSFQYMIEKFCYSNESKA